MGEARNRKQRFLAEHPFCCFCGGATAATTIDHVPARTCFPDRIAPEGFEFPACQHCQSATRLDELAFGFYAKLGDPDYTPSNDEIKKGYLGLKNNLPHLLPDLNLSTRDKRNSLRQMGVTKPTHILAADVPLAGLPSDIHAHFLRYAWKLACAIFYREKGRVAPPNYFVWATWTQSTNPKGMEALETFLRITPLVVRGARRNMPFGDRFAYRCNNDDSDVLAAIAQFGAGMILALLVVDPPTRNTLLGKDDWVEVSRMFDPNLSR